MAASERKLSYRLPAWGALFLLLVYLLYLYQSYTDLHALNQHELGLQVREFESIVTNAAGTVSSAGKDLCRFDVDQPYVDLDSSQKCGDFKEGDLKDKPASIKIEDRQLIITKGDSTPAKPAAKFRVLLDFILAELAFPESFQLFFLADDKGDVIHWEAPTGRRWRRNLSWHENNFREPAPAEREDLVIANLQELLGKDPTPGFAQLSSAGSRLSLELGGVKQAVYLQPVKLNGKRALMGGVVPATELLRSALEVDTYMTALLLFVLFAGVLAIPFVKLVSLDRRERFRQGDIRALYLSSGALMILGIFAVLARDGYCRFRDEADRGLQVLADDLSKRFADEIAVGVRQLDQFDRELASRRPSFLDCDKKPLIPKWFSAKAPLPVNVPSEAIFAEQVAWLGSDGEQLFKATGDSLAEHRKVPGWLYFRAIRQESAYRLAGLERQFFFGPSLSISDGKFYTFFSLKSRITQHGCDPTAGHNRQNGERLTAVLTTRLLSVRQPLPTGHGFAVINREGSVLYHSDRRLALRQNLFAELGDSARLKALVLAGQPGDLSTAYHERPYRFVVKPFTALQPERAPVSPIMPSAQLFVISFRDVSAEMATAAHVFVASFALILGVTLVWVGVLIAVEVVARWSSKVDRYGTWMWPQQSMARFYRWYACSLLALLGLSATLFLINRESSQVAFLVAPVVAGVLAAICQWRTREPGGGRGRLESPFWRNAMWVSLLVCMIMAPATVLFRMELGHEFGKLVETERAWIEQRKIDIDQAIRQDAREEEYPVEVLDRVSHLAETYRVPPPSPFGDKAGRIGLQVKEDIVEWIEKITGWVPIHTETAIRLRLQESQWAYYSPGPDVIGWLAALGLLVFFVAAIWCIMWIARRIFLIDCKTPTPGRHPDDQAYWQEQWDRRPEDERNLLIQISQEGMANPWQFKTVRKLLAEGYLKLDPDLRPATAAFRQFLQARANDEFQKRNCTIGKRSPRSTVGTTFAASCLLAWACSSSLSWPPSRVFSPGRFERLNRAFTLGSR